MQEAAIKSPHYSYAPPSALSSEKTSPRHGGEPPNIVWKRTTPGHRRAMGKTRPLVVDLAWLVLCKSGMLRRGSDRCQTWAQSKHRRCRQNRSHVSSFNQTRVGQTMRYFSGVHTDTRIARIHAKVSVVLRFVRRLARVLRLLLRGRICVH